MQGKTVATFLTQKREKKLSSSRCPASGVGYRGQAHIGSLAKPLQGGFDGLSFGVVALLTGIIHYLSGMIL